MSDRAAFLAHIADHPDADLPRLVFADWLDEQDDPLGEFIRVQIELSHLQDRLGDDHTQRLLAREDELLADHEKDWTDGWDLKFERGLPVQVRLDGGEFVTFGRSVIEKWPTIRAASIKDENVHRLHGDGGPLPEVPTIHIETIPEPERVHTIINSPNWNPATTLRLNIDSEDNRVLLGTLVQSAGRLSRVEFVQEWQGLRTEGERRAADGAAEEAVEFLNASVGRALAVLVRPYDRLYPLCGDIGGGFFAGHLKSGAATLFRLGGERISFCTFTDEGRIDKSLWEDSRVAWTLDRVRERFGFELGFIRVREFEANNRLAVRFWEVQPRYSPFDDDSWFDWIVRREARFAEHLADPKCFFLGVGDGEIQMPVSYRTGKAFAAK